MAESDFLNSPVFNYREITPGAAAVLERVRKRFGTWAREVAAEHVMTESPGLLTEGGVCEFNLLLTQTGDTLHFLIVNEPVPHGEESQTGLWISTPGEEDAKHLQFLEAVRASDKAMEVLAMEPDEVDERIEDLKILTD